MAFLAFFFLGLAHSIISREDNSLDHIINVEGTNAYIGIVNEPGEEKEKTFKYNLSIVQARTSEGWQTAKGEIIVYVDKKSHQPIYGDKLIINKPPTEISSTRNPNQFDYKHYSSLQGVYHQQYLKGEDFKILGSGFTNPVLSFAYDVREWALSVVEQNIDGREERSIIQALILGYKNDLDREIKSAYASSGAMHILAVSGLHVGIIYGLFYFLLGRLRQGNKTRWLFALIVLCALWFYAAITGFSPSVFRAATMFSFIVLAGASGRSTNIYNTLAASAFVLLLYDPMLILSVGFQLSFLAVIGIVYIQPKIYGWLPVENWFLEKLWSLTTVAVAVQLATFPLGLFYFHQFPSYFFLSNLVAIPAAFLILVLGIAMLILSWIPLLASILGEVLELVVYSLNYTIFWLEKLPFHKINNVNISIHQTWFIYAFTISLLLMFTLRKDKLIYVTLAAAIGFSVIQWMSVTENKMVDQLIVYDLGNNLAIELLHNQQSLILADTLLTTASPAYEFNILGNHIANGVKKVDFQSLDIPNIVTWKGVKMLIFRDKRIMMIDEAIPNFNFTKRIEVDYIILSKSGNVDLLWLKNNFSFKHIIMDKSIDYWTHYNLKKQLDEWGMSYHSVRDRGALVIDL